MTKMRSWMLFHVVFSASLIFHATDSLSAAKQGDKAQGRFYTVCQRLILNQVA